MCDVCQRFAGITRLPSADQIPIISLVPFARWGLDFVGKLPKAPGQLRYILVAIDYFSMWV